MITKHATQSELALNGPLWKPLQCSTVQFGTLSLLRHGTVSLAPSTNKHIRLAFIFLARSSAEAGLKLSDLPEDIRLPQSILKRQRRGHRA